jgi:hypothetical protein
MGASCLGTPPRADPMAGSAPARKRNNNGSCLVSPRIEGTRQVDSHSDLAMGREDANDWRKIPEQGVTVIVKELNDALDAQEFGLITPLPERGAVDFSFGERVFRVVLRPSAAVNIRFPMGRFQNPDVLFVLSRLSRT